MTGTSKRQLIFEVKRVQTVRRKIETSSGYCRECCVQADFVDLSELATTFEVSVAEAVLQLRERGVHMQHHLESGNIIVCISSLLSRCDGVDQLLTKSLPPAADFHQTFPSE